MNQRTLILADNGDVHAHGVMEHLDKLGVKVERFTYDQFTADAQISLRIGDCNDTLVKTADGRTFDFRSYDSIWHRRPGSLAKFKMPFPWAQQYVASETRGALAGTLNAMECLWVNHPANDSECSLKLLQLRKANKIGLAIPETLVTNDPKLAREFYESHGGEVIYKPIVEASTFCLPSSEMPSGVPTLLLRDADLEFIDQTRNCPTLFQKKIQKLFDIRTTVIGKKIFSFRIDSQLGSGKIDWRQDYSVPMSPYELPDETSQHILELMRELGLNYGAFDFCVPDDGKAYFLEVNCAGQYLWLEERTKVQLSKELALLLAGKSEPIIPAGTLT